MRKVSGTSRESVVREAFKDLLKGWGRSHDLIFIPEYEITTPAKDRRYVDGALLYELRVPFGYWEAKDEKDDIDAEIALKFSRGYPQDNIIFEDSRQAVLIQDRQEIMRCAVDDVQTLQKLLNHFFSYQRPEIADFRKAVDQFKTDLPAVLTGLRDMIELADADNAGFRTASAAFLKHAKNAINPSITEADVREILIQHILTEEIFSAVFPNQPFHQDNNVAHELYKLEATFFTGNTKFKTLKALEPYYAAIRGAASQISNHHEKQTFLKVIYENFYKVYNIKAADRLGVVYTPNEIVRFMIEGTDWLCEKHFGKNLIDKDVDILDPATGTGTFICELMEHFRGQPAKLRHKYEHELHCNEVSILPYYVANLNIEATYAAISGEYIEFPNLCFVDTLDNTYGLRKRIGDQMGDLFGSVSQENVGRIRRQNAKRISVVIGNPPYNANQLNENDNNKNRTYPEIDKRIKETYIKKSTAQKTKVYDMYARFFRWASDRVDENGIVAFITNRSFIDSRTFDGFRKDISEEFDEIYIVDLGGDVRSNPKLSGTKNNVFGIQTGVAISFLIKKKTTHNKTSKTKSCRIFYTRRPEFDTKDDKLSFLSASQFENIEFQEIKSDKKANWLNQTNNDFGNFIPIASKEVKAGKKTSWQEKAIFKLFSLGVVTARDEWMTDHSIKKLEDKVKHFSKIYSEEMKRWSQMPTSKFKDKKTKKKDLRDFVSREIKWTEELEAHLERGTLLDYNKENLRPKILYRPYSIRSAYYAKGFTHRIYKQDFIFPIDGIWKNKAIVFDISGNKKFSSLTTNLLPDYHTNGDSVCVPLLRYENNNTLDNVTDWALDQFKKNYQPGKTKHGRPITKESIFYYVYGVLHDPIYLEKYALNLKRDFPHIPFYADFWQWSDWGKTLADLHMGFESAMPFPLTRVNLPAPKSGAIKSRLKADKDNGIIFLDDITSLKDIPPTVWDYKLGNRSAIEWILDQYKESKPKDPTIREKFNTYKFADYKEQVIDLIMRVTTVSVETIKIVSAMKNLQRE